MKNLIIAVILGAILFWLTGCHKPFGIVGNNSPGTETRQMVSFDEVVSDALFNVYISQDTIYEVVVEAETNIIPFVRTMVNGNKLIIDTRESLTTHYPVNVYVKTPSVKNVELNGSGFVFLDTLDLGNLRVELNGSGDIRGKVNAQTLYTNLDGSGDIAIEAVCYNIESEVNGSGDISLLGEANKGFFTISGSGNINGFDFALKECNAKIRGSGDIYVRVANLLDANISGSGSIYYIGNPVINVVVTGSGSVIKH